MNDTNQIITAHFPSDWAERSPTAKDLGHAPPAGAWELSLKNISDFLEEYEAENPERSLDATAFQSFILRMAEEDDRKTVISALLLMRARASDDEKFRNRYIGTLEQVLTPGVRSVVWQLAAEVRTRFPNAKPSIMKRLRRKLKKTAPKGKQYEGILKFGLMRNTWEDTLAGLYYRDRTVDEDLLKWCHENYAKGDLSLEDYADRAKFGLSVRDLTLALNSKKPDQQKRFGNSYQEKKAQVTRGLVSRLDPPPTLEKIDTYLAQGRNVVITITHAGFLHVLRNYTRTVDTHIMILGIGDGERVQEGERAHHISLGADNPRALLQLIRDSREAPKAIGIAADGGKGGSSVEVDLLGRPMKLNTGPGEIAYAMNAAVFHAGSEWAGDGVIRIPLIEGPVVQPGMTKEDWIEQYTSFVLDRMAEIVQGPPESLMLNGGMWDRLKEAEAKVPEQVD